MSVTSRLLWISAAVLFAAVILLAWIRLGPMLEPEAAQVAPLNRDCSLREGRCETRFSDGSRVAFEMAPRHIPVVEQLELSVLSEGIVARQVEVDFSGVDMNMGYNRVTLEAVGPGEYLGSAMLPVCVRARMTWEAKVLLHTSSGLMAAPFRFDTYLPGRGPSAANPEVHPE